MSDLSSITDRLNAATPGPWHWDDDQWLMTGTFGVVLGVTEPVQGPDEADSVNVGHADALFIANAPEDIAYLLGEEARWREAAWAYAADVSKLEAQREAVLAIHRRGLIFYTSGSTKSEFRCTDDHLLYPCPTVVALGGETE